MAQVHKSGNFEFYRYCSGRRVFYSVTTGRTTEIAEVSRRQSMEYWKIGPKVLTNGKLRREQLMLLESMLQGFCSETSNGPSSEVLSKD